MDLSRYLVTASTTIQAPPEQVWASIADVTRMGEFSPVCRRAEWDDGFAAAAVGAWFTGHNADERMEWSTRCRVEAAEPGREFTFVNHGIQGTHPIVRWRYELVAVDGGTEITETREVLEGYPGYLDGLGVADVEGLLDGALAATVTSVQGTLAALKEACER